VIITASEKPKKHKNVKKWQIYVIRLDVMGSDIGADQFADGFRIGNMLLHLDAGVQ
jgi:hypothetical protein